MIQSRRGFITGLVALVAAPAVVRVASLMPVSAPKLVTPFDAAQALYNQWSSEIIQRFTEAVAQDLLTTEQLFVREPWGQAPCTPCNVTNKPDLLYQPLGVNL